MPWSRLPLLAVTCLLTVAVAGCSSDEDEPASTSASGSGGGGECTTSITATYPDGTTIDLDGTTAAVQLGGGTGYTVYATDYDLPTAGIGTATVRPPAGKHVASIFVAPVNQGDAVPIKAGTTIPAGSPNGSLAFGVILYAGKKDFGMSMEEQGSLTISQVDAKHLCLEVDYRDEVKSVQGTVSADVYDSPF